MNSLYNLAARQSDALRTDLGTYTSSPDPSRKAQLNSALAALLRTVEDYENMAKRELVIAKRDKALLRASEFRQEAQRMREQLNTPVAAPSASISSAMGVRTGAESLGQRTSASAQHTQPFGTGAPRLVRPTAAYAPPYIHPYYQPYANPYTPPHVQPVVQPYAAPLVQPSFPAAQPNPYGQMPYGDDPLAAYRTQPLPYNAREDHALREHSFIQNTEAQLDSFIAQGRAVLGNLTEQRGILKETRRRLLDAANTMGLSRELIVRGR